MMANVQLVTSCNDRFEKVVRCKVQGTDLLKHTR